MADRSGDRDCPDVYSHPEGWARYGTTLKRILARALQHNAVSGPRFSVGTTKGALLLLIVALLSVGPPVRPTAQLSAQSVDALATRFASMTAVTGLEQAMTDSLLALLPAARAIAPATSRSRSARALPSACCNARSTRSATSSATSRPTDTCCCAGWAHAPPIRCSTSCSRDTA